ncbi:MAG: signal peptidase I [Erysipelotrichaceae bacterium]
MNTKVKKFFKENGLFIILIIGLLLVVNFVYKPVVISGSSMFPTLHNNDFGFASIINVKTKEIERFDIVVVNLESKLVVKRIIGLPNDHLIYKNDKLYVNGKYIEEPFLNNDYVKDIKANNKDNFTNDFEYSLTNDEYFVLGDNRINSSDSRVYGGVYRHKIITDGLFIIYPFNRFGGK